MQCRVSKTHGVQRLPRAHPKDAKIYGELKIALAKRFRDDRSGYNTAKGEFVEELDQSRNRCSEKVIH